MLSIFKKKGIDDDYLVDKLKEILDGKVIKYDKNGNSYETDDNTSKIKVIELILKMKEPKTKATNNHLHLSDKALDKLLGE